MATVQAYTKAKSDEIYDATVIDGNVVGDDLILETRGGTPINAGNVRGAQGIQGIQGNVGPTGLTGPQGIQGVAGPTGPIGATKLAKIPHNLQHTSGLFTVGGYLDIVQTDVPVVSGRTYGAKFSFEVAVANFGGTPTPEWDFHLTKNGAAIQKIAMLMDNRSGAFVQQFTGEYHWVQSGTLSTDDYAIYAYLIASGIAFELTNTRRFLAIIDYGVVT